MCANKVWELKFKYCEKATKIERNLPLFFYYYLVTTGWPDIFLGSGTLKIGSKCGLQKAGSLLLKKRRGSLASSLFGPVFFGVTKRPMFSKQEEWVQIDWVSLLHYLSQWQKDNKRDP